MQPDAKADAALPADAVPSAGTRGDQATGKVLARPCRPTAATGRRVVFAMGDQRVWLVGAGRRRVRRTYLVSGSVTDNLHPGTY